MPSDTEHCQVFDFKLDKKHGTSSVEEEGGKAVCGREEQISTDLPLTPQNDETVSFQ